MKRRLMLAAMSLILTVTLSVTSMNTVAEASPKMSPTEENLEITINSFLESDGAVAEELTDEMLKTFLETPLDFLRVIDTYPLDKQELLLSRIANVAVGMPDEERLSFEDIIYSADETTPGSLEFPVQSINESVERRFRSGRAVDFNCSHKSHHLQFF